VSGQHRPRVARLLVAGTVLATVLSFAVAVSPPAAAASPLAAPQAQPAAHAVVAGTVASVLSAGKRRWRPVRHPTATRYGLLQPVRVRHRVGRFHVEVHQMKNQVLVVNRRNRGVRQIPVAGNPWYPKPAFSRVADRHRVSYDYAYEWRLPWFTRLVVGRGIGSHAIPRHRRHGYPSMRVADLGKAPGAGAPLSRGCLRMAAANARWFFRHVPAGTPVYWR
jgi:hypothetical protein